MEVNFDTLELERQKHPGLAAEMPFDIAWLAHGGPESKLKGDVHYALQISIIVHGSAEVVYQNYSRVCNAGEMWWTMCWEPHACRLLGKHNFVLSVNLDMNRTGDCGPFTHGDFLLPFSVRPSERYLPATEEERVKVKTAAKNLFHWYSRKPALWQYRSWLTIHQLLLDAMEHIGGTAVSAGSPAESFARIKPALKQLHNTIGKLPSLAEAAKSCSLSPSRFSAVFKNSMGVSYGQFALRSRLAGAARDLAKKQYTLDDIAAKWGFCDASSFCHAFKKLYSCRPGEFHSRNPIL